MRRGERGQALILMALLSTVLIGFVGLVIDGGEIASRQQALQGVADGGAVTAAYAIGRQGVTLAAATTLAQNVAAAVGLPPSDVVPSYLNAAGTVTATVSLVRTVQVVATDTRRTFFVAALGILTAQVTATARATVWPACVLCLGATSGLTLSLNANSTVTASGGPVVINSNASPNLTLGNNAILTAPVITNVGGTYTVGTGTTLTPTPVVGPAFVDPFAGLPIPVGAGGPIAYTSAGSGNLSPGIYSSITIRAADTITLLTGTYVVTGQFRVQGTLLTGAGGVIVYLTCPVAPCSGAGAGGFLNVTNNGKATITAGNGGTYDGIAILSDPGDKTGDTVNNGDLTVNGGYEAPAKTFVLSTSNDTATFNGITVLLTLKTAGTSQVVTVNVPSTGRFADPALVP